MSRFALRGATALIALSFTFAAPVPLPAQDSPATAETAADWQVLNRLGLRLPVPATAAITDTSDRLVTASTLGDGQTGTRIDVQALTAADYAQFPAAPGTAEFATLLSQIGMVAVAPTGISLRLGDLQLDGYGGTDTRTLADGSEAATRMLFLVSPPVEGDGQGYLIAISTTGLDADQSARIEAEFVAGLALAEPAAPEPAVSEPAAPEPPASAAVTEPPVAAQTSVADAPVAADPVAAAEPATADTAPATYSTADLNALAAGLPEPATLLPAGWTQYTRMTVVMAIPDGAETRADSTDADDLAFSMTGDLDGVTYELGGRVLSPDALARLDVVPNTEEFRALLERWSDVPVAMTDRQVMLGDRPLRVYLGAGSVTEDDETHLLTVVYLVAETVDADGGLLLLGGSGTGAPAVAVAGVIGDFVESLAIAAPPPAPQPSAESLIEGLAAVTLPEGLTIASIDRNPGVTDAILAEGDAQVARLVAGPLTRPVETQLRRLLDRVDGLSEGSLGDMPVWIIDGTATRTMSNAAVTGADAPPARVVVPQVCVGGNVPYMLAISVLPGDEGRFEALLGALTLSAPVGAMDCPDQFPELRRILADRAAPATEPQPQPPVVADDGGKDPSEVAVETPAPNVMPTPIDPELAAWSQAQASGSADAVLAFVAAYPRGLHSGEARAWLHARGIVPADEQRLAPPAPSAPDADMLAWDHAMRASNPAAMWTYLKAQPQGAHRHEAMGMIDSMRRPASTIVPAPRPAPMPATPPAAPHK